MMPLTSGSQQLHEKMRRKVTQQRSQQLYEKMRRKVSQQCSYR
jgi:tRNA A37 methylthiotransferase MiaB